MTNLKSVSPVNHDLVCSLKAPEALLLFPRLILQSEGNYPPTYNRRMSFVEQDMAKYAEERSHSPLEAVLDYSRAASVFYTKQIKIYEEAGKIYHIICLNSP